MRVVFLLLAFYAGKHLDQKAHVMHRLLILALNWHIVFQAFLLLRGPPVLSQSSAQSI